MSSALTLLGDAVRLLFIFVLSLGSFASANVPSTSIHLYGFMPLILKASLSRQAEGIYFVHEISNSRDGYVVQLETDSPSVMYDGQNIAVVEGQATLTEVVHQE